MASPHRPAALGRPLTAVLRDGSRVTIRDLVPDNRALIADAFERLSPRSRFLRFLSPIPALSKRMLDQLTDVDQDRHVALVALQDGAVVGVVRFVRDDRDPSVADVAITVVDATQGRGLGRTLLTTLRDVAAGLGVRALHFDIHPENRAMTALATSLGTRLELTDGLLSGLLPVGATATPAELPAAA